MEPADDRARKPDWRVGKQVRHRRVPVFLRLLSSRSFHPTPSQYPPPITRPARSPSPFRALPYPYTLLPHSHHSSLPTRRVFNPQIPSTTTLSLSLSLNFHQRSSLASFYPLGPLFSYEFSRYLLFFPFRCFIKLVATLEADPPPLAIRSPLHPPLARDNPT